MEGRREAGREGEHGFVVPLVFMDSSITSCMCPDQAPNLQPRCIRMMI